MTTELTKAIRWDIIYLRRDWKVFREVFGTNEERVELLNRLSGEYADCFQGALFDRILMRLSHLTDPANDRRGNINQSLDALINEVRQLKDRNGDPVIGDTDVTCFEERVRLLKKSIEGIRQHRNKRLAHRDFEYKRTAGKISGTSRNEVDRAIVEVVRIFKSLTQLSFDITYFTSDASNVPLSGSFFKAVFCGEQELNRRKDELRKLQSSGKPFDRNMINEGIPEAFRKEEVTEIDFEN